MIVNKDMIAERKSLHGNNFPKLAELINNYLSNFKNDGDPILPEDAAIIMALMKVSRLNECPCNEDSMQDLFNYMYIAINYKEYEEISSDKPKSPYMNINKSDFNVNKMIRNIDKLSRDINKTQHNSGNAVDVPTRSLADLVLAYIGTKTLD